MQDRKGQSKNQLSRNIRERESVSHSAVPDSLQAHGLQPARLLCPRDSPGTDTGVGCHALLQGLPNPGIQPRSPALQADSLPSEPYVTVPQSARASQRAHGEGRDPRIRHSTQKIQDRGSIMANSPHIDKWHMGQFLTDRSVRNQWLGVVCVSQCGSCWRRNWGIHSTENKVCVLVVPSIFLFPSVAGQQA